MGIGGATRRRFGNAEELGESLEQLVAAPLPLNGMGRDAAPADARVSAASGAGVATAQSVAVGDCSKPPLSGTFTEVGGAGVAPGAVANRLGRFGGGGANAVSGARCAAAARTAQ